MSLIAIVGRPNVGKSTLFNRLVGRRLAIVEGEPGVTRDRHYADADIDGRRVTLVDTGGLDPETHDELLSSMAGQAEQAVREADLILFVTDVHQGVLPADHEVAEFLRRRARDVIVVANKADVPKWESGAADFYSLGFDAVFPVSAEHNRGVGDLTDEIVRRLGPAPEEEAPAHAPDEAVRVAVLGRPNVGKSSFVNRILGADRLVVSPVAGTTHDAIDTRVSLDGRAYVLIDTAGIRKKSRVEHGTELWSVLKAIRAIDRAEVCIV
ncbi:MAG TPA: ribosome biogenesis GTPase Der, partial [Geobacteraceae bacterium]